MTKEWTDLDYAKFAGVEIYTVHDENTYIAPDGTRCPWTTETDLGKLIIADACMRSEKWPWGWVANPHCGVVDISRNEIVVTIKENETYIDAVLAAVKEVGK